MPVKMPELKGQIAAIVMAGLAALAGAGATMGFDVQEDAVHIILYGKVIIVGIGVVAVMVQNCVTTIVTGRAPPSFNGDSVPRQRGGQR